MRARSAEAPASSGPAVARVEGAVLAYGGRRALDGVSLTLNRGEIYVLMGPNGAGKSSLVRALCGRLRLDAGTVAVGEPPRDPQASREARRIIGLVPQEIALYPRLTVRENLEVFASLAGLKRNRERIEAVLGTARLAEVASHPVAALSGGLQRRANIAVALTGSPGLLLLDEPTVGVDLEARGAIHEVLTRLRDEGVAILLVTHDFDQAERLADRVGFMAGGRLVLEGRPTALLEEAYGSGRQIEAVLADLPDARAGEILRSEGLSALEDRLVWTALAAGVEADAAERFDRLRRAGVPVREVRVREPGLDTLFRERVMGAGP
jgi:ABC-2 type transport system ATP-binding protein